jgi:hypothetical protein
MNLGTLHKLVENMPSSLTVIRGVPMDASRVQCDIEAIDEYYEGLELNVPGVPADMVINLDEAGHQDWVDAHACPVVVPADFVGSQVEVAVSRQTKRATLLGAITLGGPYLKPLVIMPDEKLVKQNFRRLDTSHARFSPIKNAGLSLVTFRCLGGASAFSIHHSDPSATSI